MSSDEAGGEGLASLTRQLRELHQRLDPQAPRYMSNGSRKQAITALLGNSGADGGSGSGGEAADDRGAEGRPRPRPAKARREATGGSGSGGGGKREVAGLKLPSTGGSRKSPVAKQQQRAAPGNNAERLWRFLFG